MGEQVHFPHGSPFWFLKIQSKLGCVTQNAKCIFNSISIHILCLVYTVQALDNNCITFTIMSTLGGRALKRILNFNCLCNNYSIQLAHAPQCTASPNCNTVVNIPIDSCGICHGIGQNYTLLLFHLYYTGEKECGVHSSFPLYTCIYWEQTVWAHSFPPIYIQERKSVTYTLSLLQSEAQNREEEDTHHFTAINIVSCGSCLL